MRRFILPFIIFIGISGQIFANRIFIPMDETQKNHLKAYGIAFWILKDSGTEIDWLLNYRGGSFMVGASQTFINECVIRGVSYEMISEADAQSILASVMSPDANMDAVKLNKAPKIAVYSPKTTQPWDDAVTMVLTYAEIPYTKIFDEEALENKLPEYDWLHLHHEDFTGQFGKFIHFRGQAWYQEQKREAEITANKYGFTKIPALKLVVAKKIRDFVLGGGYMFAMCNATDTFDIALAANGVDMVETPYDGDAADPIADKKLNFDNTLAFQNFMVGPYTNPHVVEFSNIDNTDERGLMEANDYFTLFQFSAKYDPIPSMLTQNHQSQIKGFMGQTTAFKKNLIKPEVVIMAENRSVAEARYIHGVLGKGFFTYYSGHDPEDYRHEVGEEPTDLNIHPNSAGYRLILNNILFPAAKKKKTKDIVCCIVLK